MDCRCPMPYALCPVASARRTRDRHIYPMLNTLSCIEFHAALRCVDVQRCCSDETFLNPVQNRHRSTICIWKFRVCATNSLPSTCLICLAFHK